MHQSNWIVWVLFAVILLAFSWGAYADHKRMKHNSFIFSDEWIAECKKWRGRQLTGQYAHYCNDWDLLPVDETTDEITACACFTGKRFKKMQRAVEAKWSDAR